MKESLLLICITTTITLFSQSTTLEYYRIANWSDNKAAAVSLTFDDWIPTQKNTAMPLLKSKNLTATFFVQTNNLSTLPGVENAQTAGFEMANHSKSHPSLATLSDANMITEISGAKQALAARGINAVTLAYPNGSGGGDGTNEQNVRNITARYNIAARAVGSSPNQYNLYKWGTLPFTNDSYYRIGSQMMGDWGPNVADFTYILNDMILNNGWYVPCYHGVGGDWVITSTALFTQQMDVLVSKSKQIWITTFKNAVCYHKERHCQSLTTVSEDANAWTLNLTDTLTNNAIYNQPLTIRMKKPSWTIYSIKQGMLDLVVTTETDSIMFNATPDAGNIVVSKKQGVTGQVTPDTSPIKIYPRPASELVAFENLEKDTLVEVFNESGLLVFQASDISQINVSNWKAGIYFARMTSKTAIKQEKLIVIH